MNNLSWVRSIFALSLLVSGASAPATTAMYTFDSFTFLQTTPLLNCSPEVGPPGFLASFASSPNPAAFSIGTVAPNPSFSGQNLMDTSHPSSSDTLTITVNRAITAVHFDFALFSPGHLELHSLAGMASASTGLTQAGNLSFQSNTGFTQFSLTGFDTSDLPTMLAIDNLSLTIATVPEPSAGWLLLAGLGLCWIRKQCSSPGFA